MIVTLYLSGSPFVLPVGSLQYEELENAMLTRYPEDMNNWPVLSFQSLRVIYKATPDATVNLDFEIPPQADSIPDIDPNWTDISICVAVDVKVYNKPGRALAVSKDAKPLFSLKYCSNASPDKFVARLDLTLRKHLDKDDVSMATSCCTATGLLFAIDHLFDPAKMEPTKTYFVVQERSSYSNATVSQLLTKVSFPDGVLQLVSEGVTGVKRKANESTKYLDAFSDLVGKETPLMQIIKRKREELADSKEWADRVDACVANLAILNRHVQPAAIHSESARRLLINEVVKQVISHADGVFYVEEPQNKGKEDKRFLGWGPLDYTLSASVVVDVVGDRAEAEEEAVHRAHLSMEEGEGDTTEETAPERKDTIEEAKVQLDDYGLAQGGSQSYDWLLAHPEMNRMALLLCTGHKWRHFVLQRGASEGDTKPMLTYFGEVSMSILRSTVAYTATASQPKGDRRPSCRYLHDYNVDRTQVEDVMLGLYCSVTHQLDPAEVTSAGMQAGAKPAATTIPPGGQVG